MQPSSADKPPDCPVRARNGPQRNKESLTPCPVPPARRACPTAQGRKPPPRPIAASERRKEAPKSCARDWPPEMQRGVRSEEHTSELQSLMRISYAVFCLNKKKQKQTCHEFIHSIPDSNHAHVKPDNK